MTSLVEGPATARAVQDLLPEVAGITDPLLRDAVVGIWLRAWRSSAWDDLAAVPKSMDLPDRRTLTAHTRSVTQMTGHMVDVVTDLHGVTVDRDAALAIALLHDVSKIFEFEPDPNGGGQWSTTGRRYQHGFLGAHWMLQAGLAEDLVRAVIAHTPHSSVVPQTQEAVIVHYADFADSDVQLLDARATLFCKRKS